MICTINSKKVLRCLFSDSGKVLLELPFTKGLFPLKKSMFVVTSRGEQIKHISLLAKQAGSPLHAAAKPKEQSSHFAMFLLVFHFWIIAWVDLEHVLLTLVSTVFNHPQLRMQRKTWEQKFNQYWNDNLHLNSTIKLVCSKHKIWSKKQHLKCVLKNAVCKIVPRYWNVIIHLQISQLWKKEGNIADLSLQS